ncbi:MAG: Gfo/Idh/MocA family oxidoreductase [Bryobacteraceae bacterium]|nr:Gfo/Idh/MocA family oxidoreductase [Bryobacteraceae bacterium]
MSQEALPPVPAKPANIRVGIIGLGAMGRIHLEKLSQSARVVALCDVHRSRLYEAAESLDFKVASFADYRELLAFPDVDAVVIATPDHWHSRMTIDACDAGKDVYVETPATTTPADGRRMVEAARRKNLIVQVGAFGRSNAAARKACEYLRNGKIGRIERVVCWGPVNAPHMPHAWGQRPMPLPPAGRATSVAPQDQGTSGGLPAPAPATSVAAPPRMSEPIKLPAATSDDVPAKLNWREWLGPLGERPFSADLFTHWRDYFDVGGGHLCGIGSQVLGLASWIMQVDATGPVRVEARGGEPDPQTSSPRELEVTWTFAQPDWELVWSQPGQPLGKELDHGAAYHGTTGTLNIYGGAFGVGTEPKAWNWKPAPADKPVPFSPGHLANWLECIRTRERPMMDLEAGHRVATLAWLGNKAWKQGKVLNWDPRTETVS